MNNSTSSNGGAPKPFQTSEEAVAQGKKDLQEALRLNPELKMGIDAAQLERSKADAAVTVTEVDFQKLLQAENPENLGSIAGASRGNATPFSLDGQVIGLIETRKDPDGWKVSAIGNQAIKNELNEIRKAGLGADKIAYFEVPNLNVRIYGVTAEGKEAYLTEYNGFSLRKPVPAADLIKQLKTDATEFQKLYGDKLKDQKLVN